MKAVRLRPARMPNPEWTKRNRSVPRWIEQEAGSTVESSDAPLLCIGRDPALAPADEECRLAVMKLLQNPKRRRELERLQQMYQMRSQLSEGARKYVEKLFEKHEAEINSDASQQVAVVPADDDAAGDAEPAESAVDTSQHIAGFVAPDEDPTE